MAEANFKIMGNMYKLISIAVFFLAITCDAIAQNSYEKYIEAANNGDAEAQYYIGKSYAIGDGVEKNDRKAVIWYNKSAEQGNSDAMFELGMCFYKGIGISQNYERANYWIMFAIQKGNEKAKEWLGKSVLAQAQAQSKGKKQTHINVDDDIPLSLHSNDNTFVVIIGNEIYDNEAPVPYAEHDAEIFRKYVQKALGVPDNQIYYSINAGLNKLRIALRWLSKAMDVTQGKGKAIFYYAGHGISNEMDKRPHLLPVDGISSDIESAYSLDLLYQSLSNLSAQSIIVFLDTNFSGSKRDGGMMASARGVAIKTKTEDPRGKMVVFTAAQGDETAYSYKSQQHGMFTYYLLRKLQETKGNVTLGDLSDYINHEVKRQAFDENNKIQTPTVISSTSLGESWKNLKLK